LCDVLIFHYSLCEKRSGNSAYSCIVTNALQHTTP
jgi:hypothetical protein